MDSKLLKQVLENIKNGNKDHLQTGFKNLDSIQIPQKGAFILVGGRPCMGKTSFIYSLLLNIAPKQKILLFSPEYSKETAIKKLLFIKSGIGLKKLSENKLNSEEYKTLAKNIGEMANWDIKLCDDSAIELSEIERKISEQRPNIVFIEDIDSIKLINDKVDKIQMFSSLQKLAHEKKCVIFATTTLTRNPEEREDHRPIVSDLKEFKSTKYIDFILLIYREAYYGYPRSKKCMSANSEIIVGKNKYSDVGAIRLEFDPEYGRFYEIDNEFDEWPDNFEV